MKQRMLWSAVVACSLLAGCAAMYPREPRKSAKLECDGTSACTVNVDVRCSHWHGCELSLDYDLILVRGRGRSVEIDWQLSGEAAAEFAGNGIALDSSEFECRPKEKRQFGCVDKHAGFGVFKYTVNVTIPGSAFGPRGVPALDPWIVND
jgi:hypothetical protein